MAHSESSTGRRTGWKRGAKTIQSIHITSRWTASVAGARYDYQSGEQAIDHTGPVLATLLATLALYSREPKTSAVVPLTHKQAPRHEPASLRAEAGSTRLGAVAVLRIRRG